MQLIRKCLAFTLSVLMAFSGPGAMAAMTPAGVDDSKPIPDNTKNEANLLCENAKVFSEKLIKNVCWDCILPIRLMGVTVYGSKYNGRKPSSAASGLICTCDDPLGVPIPGVMTQFWEPFRMLELENIPGCASAMNGIRFPFRKTFLGGPAHNEEGSEGLAFKHYHFYAFPVMIMLEMFIPKGCNPGGYLDFDIMFLSEVDPTWNDDVLAFFSMPENSLVANLAAVVACLPDAVSASFAQKPINTLFWCAGAWGSMYPTSGNWKSPDVINHTSLLSARVLVAGHRRGTTYRTVGTDAACGGIIDPTMPKDMYRMSVFHPIPETSDNHVIGETALKWGLARMIPAAGENPVYIVWRWLDCCNIKSDALDLGQFGGGSGG